MQAVFILGVVVAVLTGVFLIYACIVSYLENEKAASIKLVVATVFLLLISGMLATLDYRLFSGFFILIPVILLICFCFKYPEAIEQHPNPNERVDERDVIFSRFKLAPDSNRFDRYYQTHPERKVGDDETRKLPGLLNPRALYYDEQLFNQASEYFREIDRISPEIDGEVNRGSPPLKPSDPQTITSKLKEQCTTLGVHSVGVVRLKPEHFYTHKGRGDRYGEAIDTHQNHTHAVVFTVEMDHRMVASAPAAPIVAESSKQYLNSANIAIQLGKEIRNMGYEAKAHIDGNYELICPLVARDAGLGEIGRMGLLMDPKLGPRCRIAVVTTSLLLVEDRYQPDSSVIHFCNHCKKCASTCPGQCISKTSRTGSPGNLRWTIDQDACYRLWSKVGTDCGRCMSVCPYSHPNNLLHNVIRFGIRHSRIIGRIAIIMDDVLYGKHPKPKPKSY